MVETSTIEVPVTETFATEVSVVEELRLVLMGRGGQD